MQTGKIIVKEVFKSANREEVEKALRDNIIKLISRRKKRGAQSCDISVSAGRNNP